ncbi:MAG: hypothetical protein RR133_03090, partial [Kiritimatiellia bacterium]
RKAAPQSFPLSLRHAALFQSFPSAPPADRQRYRLSAVRHRLDSPMKAAQMAVLCTGKLK